MTLQKQSFIIYNLIGFVGINILLVLMSISSLEKTMKNPIQFIVVLLGATGSLYFAKVNIYLYTLFYGVITLLAGLILASGFINN